MVGMGRHDPEAPAYVRSCGSPTILVDGRDETPPLTTAANGCCRLYAAGVEELRGAPAANVITAVLQRHFSNRRWSTLLAPVPGVVAVVLPTCPLCWPLYAAALSALGFGYLLDEPLMLLLAGVLLLFTLVSAGYKAGLRHGYGPLLIGALGASAVLLGKLVWISSGVAYGGLTLILGASLWNVRPRKARECRRCENA